VPFRGQRLFVRTVTPDDFSELRRLKADFRPSENAVLGRLVGETVCFAAYTLLGAGTLRIDDFFVAPALRQKRIGRVLLAELEQLAARLQCRELVISTTCQAPVFFGKMGYSEIDSVLRKALA
jgi:N-acetylglutamate synthase-like GNAT family acetyltransferase